MASGDLDAAANDEGSFISSVSKDHADGDGLSRVLGGKLKQA
jgi:hypothetical protein